MQATRNLESLQVQGTLGAVRLYFTNTQRSVRRTPPHLTVARAPQVRRLLRRHLRQARARRCAAPHVVCNITHPRLLRRHLRQARVYYC
jgi:hypothetical protein